MRWQFHHVIDVAPTILEAAGLPEPLFVNGVQQHPIEGVSMAYSFDDAQAPDRHETQYFEMFGNRGIYHKGWTAVTKHKTPWILVGEQTVAFDDDVWELYDTTKDWSQAKDLAKEMPEKLHELQRLWLIEATRYNVLPLDDDTASRINPDLAGRPVLIRGNTQVLFSNMGRLSENCVLNLKNKSHTVTAEVEVPETGAEGVIVAQGASIGGWSLYANDGKLKYCYNLGGIKHFYAESADPLPAGAHQVRMEFAYAGGGLGKGGEVTLYVDGQQVGEGHVEATLAIVFSADGGCDVGMDSGSPVSPDYAPGVTRSTGGSRACSSRSPRPPLLRAIWSTRSTRSASRWRANRAAQSNGEGTAMEKSRCHAVAHGGGCAGSAKSHKSGGRCGQGRGAGDSHGTRGAGRRYRAASAPHPLAVGAHLRDELAKRSADPRLTDELNDLAGHTLDDL